MISSFAIGRINARAFFVCALPDVLRWLTMLLVAWVLAACGGGGGGESVAQPSLAITQQPADQRVVTGSSATLRVAANGAASFQWQRLGADAQWTDIAGATQTELVLSGLTEADNGRQYRAQVKAGAVVLTSSAATLTVTPPLPAGVAAEPSDVQARAGQAPSFNVTASGTNVAYQWQSSTDGLAWTDVAGATSETLTLPTVTLADSGKLYRVVVRNNLATVTSRAVTLSVLPALQKPLFTAQPQDRSVIAGDAATFTATASGEPMPTLQWDTSPDGQAWTPVAGVTTSTLTVNAAPTDNGRRYRAVATNSQGSETSGVAKLTIAQALAPTFVRLPAAVTVLQAQSAAFEVEATGTPTPTYQWQVSLDDGKSFTNVNGATSARLELATTVEGDEGKLFRVVASNVAGDVTSPAARLSLLRMPQVTLQPQDIVSIATGIPVTLKVAAAGSPAPGVQWQTSRDEGETWQDIPGATAASYSWSPSRNDDRRLLRARLANTVGAVYSKAVRLRRDGVRWISASPAPVEGLISVRWLDNKVAVAVGRRGVIIRTADAGSSWHIVQEAMKDSQTYRVLSVLDASTVVAACHDGTIIRSEDAGLTWRTLPIPVTGQIRSISFRNSSIGVLTPNDGGALRTVDGGFTWTRIPTADPAKPFENLTDIALRGTSGFATGQSAWFRSTDSGSSWSAVNVPSSFLKPGSGESTYVAFVDDQTLMVSGVPFARSTDGGQTWQAKPRPVGEIWSRLRFSRDGQVGFDLDGKMITVDRGATWSAYRHPSFLARLTDADYSPDNLMLSVGNYGALRLSTDKGMSLGAIYGNPSMEDVHLWGVAFPDNDGRGIAFGKDSRGIASGDYSPLTVVYQTNDGGFTWRPLQQFGDVTQAFVDMYSGPGHVSFSDAKVGMAVRLGGPLLRTTDGGRSWVEMPKYPTGSFGLAVVGTDTVIMGSDRGLSVSVDGGNTWKWQDLAYAPVKIGARGNLVLVPTNSGKLFRSTDGAKNWSLVSYPGSGPSSIAWIGNSTVAILERTGAIYRSDDDGLTWRTMRQPTVPRDIWYEGLRFSADGQIGVFTSPNAVYWSRDGGGTWDRDETAGLIHPVIDFAGPRQPVLVEQGGSVRVGSGF